MVRRSYPFSRHNARERNAYAGCSIQPGRGRFANQLFAEVAGEVVTVIGEQIIGGCLKLLRDFFDYVLDFILGTEGEALQ